MQLFVFDLDFTLWNAGGTWCDCTTPPFRKEQYFVKDAHGRKIELYQDVRSIIKHLKNNNMQLAIASRTEEPAWAKQILDLLEIRHLFDFEEIFPDRKTVHFNMIQNNSKIDYSEMVFFDDEYRNIEDVSKLGVSCEWVKNGICNDLIMKYL